VVTDRPVEVSHTGSHRLRTVDGIRLEQADAINLECLDGIVRNPHSTARRVAEVAPAGTFPLASARHSLARRFIAGSDNPAFPLVIALSR
jgi:hypothetical protein